MNIEESKNSKFKHDFPGIMKIYLSSLQDRTYFIKMLSNSFETYI